MGSQVEIWEISFKAWSLELSYRNAPILGLALSKRNICEISTKNCVTSRIMIEKASNHIETLGLSL